MSGACCTSDSCIDTTADVCNELIENLEGKFHHNLTCDQVNCNEGLCCVNGHSVMATEVGCYARGGLWKGTEYDKYSYDCSIMSGEPIQACCFGDSYAADDPANTGTCSDLPPSVCLRRGGTPRGPESRCSVITSAGGCSITGATAHGKCCVAGQCHQADEIEGSPFQYGYTAGDCSSIGGVYGGSGSTCGVDSDQVGGNTFDRSWPCSWPTGACCFGTNPFAGYVYCGSSGHTYGSCTLPPSMGGSGGSAWQIGVTCGHLNEFPLEKIDASPTPIEDGPEVICTVPGTAYGACCVTTTQVCTLNGEYKDVELVTDVDCYGTNESGCNVIGGEFTPNEDGCDGLGEEGCGDTSEAIVGCCGQFTFVYSGSTMVQECNEGVDILTCQAQADEFFETYDMSDVLFAHFGFSTECQGIAEICGLPPVYYGCVCVYIENENGELEYLESRATEALSSSDLSNPDLMINYGEDNFADDYPGLSVKFSKVNYSSQGESASPSYCEGDTNPCTDPVFSPVLGACCSANSQCSNAAGVIKCSYGTTDTTFFPNLSCGQDAGYLPCGNQVGNPVNVCINEQISGMTESEIRSVSHCIDKHDFATDEFNYQSALDYMIDPAGPIHNIESLSFNESPDYDCEDCEFACTRNRGICCWYGNPIYNTTKEECSYFNGAIFAGCQGKPWNNAIQGGMNYTPQEFDCSSLFNSISNKPSNIRATAIPAHKQTRFRRGPHRKATGWENDPLQSNDICKATSSDWRDTEWTNYDGYGNAILANESLNPVVPMVQLFWNSPEISGLRSGQGNRQSDNSSGWLKSFDDPSVCKSNNLKDCYTPLTDKGSCCVRKSCESVSGSELKEEFHNCFECVPNVSECECAVLNNSRTCTNVNWISNRDITSSECTNCPCQDINNSNYQINSFCTPSSDIITDPLNEPSEIEEEND